MLRDLIFPDNGVLSNSKSFQKLKSELSLTPGVFSAAFWKGVEQKNDPAFNVFLNQLSNPGTNMKKKDNPQVSTWEPIDVTLYYPYSYEYMNPHDLSGNYSPETSVMTANADADEGYGWKPIYDSNGNMGYVKVIINDDYAYSNPTHIVGINGIEPIYATTGDTYEIFPPGLPVQVPSLSREVREVFVGEVRCKNQYDRLISFTKNGGGSEIRFTRGDGYLKIADGQVTADTYVINGPTDISRWHIRNEKWVDWTVSWDQDWESENKEQNITIYEDDNASSVTKSYGVKTTLKEAAPSTNTFEGNVGGSIVYKSNDEIIHQQNYKWEIFFSLNRGATGDPTQTGWKIYDNNSPLSFTLPDRTFVP